MKYSEIEISHEETVRKWDEIANNITDKNMTDIYNEIYYSAQLNMVYPPKGETDPGIIAIEKMHQTMHNVIEIQENWNCQLVTTEKNEIKRLLYLTLFAIKPGGDLHKIIENNRALMVEKNLLYGSSWSIMRPVGIIDIIHVKIHRVLSLIDGKEEKFESITDSLEDIINYCIFCLIRRKND